MRPGDEITCPKCGRNSFLKKVAILDGWTKKGEIFACASCSAKIADAPVHGQTERQAARQASALAAFLNENEAPIKTRIEAGESEKRFCRDCTHFIKHPFGDKCGLHDRNVNPMDDCRDFNRKQ